jgi:hypothetical protein
MGVSDAIGFVLVLVIVALALIIDLYVTEPWRDVDSSTRNFTMESSNTNTRSRSSFFTSRSFFPYLFNRRPLGTFVSSSTNPNEPHKAFVITPGDLSFSIVVQKYPRTEGEHEISLTALNGTSKIFVSDDGNTMLEYIPESVEDHYRSTRDRIRFTDGIQTCIAEKV